MMVALLLYAYAVGERSSRRIERHCEQDVAFWKSRPTGCPITPRSRVSASVTSVRSGSCSARCWRCARRPDFVQVGVIAVDGTNVHANASQHATRDYEQIAAEILAQADAVDRADDERYGEQRGDELPAEFSTAQARRGGLLEAKRRLDDRRAYEACAILGPRRQRLQEAKRRLQEEPQVDCQANADREA
jgi:hypothetical protein